MNLKSVWARIVAAFFGREAIGKASFSETGVEVFDAAEFDRRAEELRTFFSRRFR
jgi:hypothetical protein